MIAASSQILLVEDDPTLSEVTAFRLELLGYEVRCARSAEEALAATAEQLPDVVLRDFGLEGNEGYELLDRLSNEQYTADVPVMVFCTTADLDDVQRAFTSGAKEFLVTPFDPAVLEKKVEVLCAK